MTTTSSNPTPPRLHTRREFLRTSMLGAAVSLSHPRLPPEDLLRPSTPWRRTPPFRRSTGKDGPILIVLQLAGGNDGMNTVIPYADDAYYRARPVIGIAAGQSVIKLNDYVGLNPKLAGLKGLYDEGHLSILQGVGYPNPNRSHFRSTEIWQTALRCRQNRAPTAGSGRYFDSCCKGADPTVGVAIGNQMPQSFAAAHSDRGLLLAPRAIPLGQWRQERRDSARRSTRNERSPSPPTMRASTRTTAARSDMLSRRRRHPVAKPRATSSSSSARRSTRR